MTVRNGHQYLTVLPDLEAKRVLFGVEGKGSEVRGRFAGELEKRGGDSGGVEQVVIDMSSAYMKGARENFNGAQVVFDKFHVVRAVNEAVDEVRRL